MKRGHRRVMVSSNAKVVAAARVMPVPAVVRVYQELCAAWAAFKRVLIG